MKGFIETTTLVEQSMHALAGVLQNFRQEATGNMSDFTLVMHPAGIVNPAIAAMASSCEDNKVIAAALRFQADAIDPPPKKSSIIQLR